MRRHLCFLTVCSVFLSTIAAAVPRQAIELRNLGFAELENENPDKAEPIYRQLIGLVPGDPLGHANLAIALLRQQKYPDALTAIDKALDIAPGQADLLAIKGEILQWTGDLDGAVAMLAKAAKAAPEDLEILYAAYQLAATLGTPEAEPVALDTLRRLAKLRPENVVVLLQLGQRSIAAGDRTTATGAYQRIGELLWQEAPITTRALGMVNEALEKDDLGGARVPAVRLENVLKVSAMFRESLRELRTGIQGIPLQRFREEAASDNRQAMDFGDPLTIELAGARLDERPTAGRALAAGDFDGDEKPDLARIRADGKLEIRLAAAGWKVTKEYAAAELDELLAADIDNDGKLDLLAFGAERATAWRGQDGGAFAAAADHLGLAAAGAAAAVVVDYDIEGDRDLALAGRAAGPADLYRNPLEGGLERVGVRALPRLPYDQAQGLAVADLDRDGDLDVAVAHGRGVAWLDNLRQGRFADRTAAAGLGRGKPLAAVAAADLDNDGLPDLIGAGAGLVAWRNAAGDFRPWPISGLPDTGEMTSVVAFDADNDGRFDLAAAGPAGLQVLGQQKDGSLAPITVSAAPAVASTLVAADLDSDGDLDLAVAGSAGLHWLENRGGNQNHWLQVRLRGLTKGNSKNNFYGVGSLVEVRNGSAYQTLEATGDVVHIGLGRFAKAEVLRVVWTNGVPQNRIALAGNSRLVEEQLLKGSCPFLYAWDGQGFTFVTDLLWGAPLGLPVAADAWAPADPAELVRVDGLVARAGRYDLRITEELWEAAFFDHLRLWVVDHPVEVEVASSLKILPGATVPERVLASRRLRPVAAAWDGRGREVSERVDKRDEIYADGYPRSPYQGVAATPWTFTFDLGEAPSEPVRLHLDGWIFPADASLNLAVAQRRDLTHLPPRLEVETADGWRPLMPQMGFPAGKTKTMVVDLPPLPPGAHKLRIVSSQWLHWDRIAWTTAPADDEPLVVARLTADHAELRYRGYSELVRRAPNAPHAFDYAAVRHDSPWLPFPGHYTRYGDVSELLTAADDFSVILAPGDEMALSFDATALPPLAAGHRRTIFLESHGWDKDADRNTWEAQQLEPLPFRAMSGYPYGTGESYPESEAHRQYRREWLTREVGGRGARPGDARP